jgi:CubicO group peptidase (beta-lactamase class C family)
VGFSSQRLARIATVLDAEIAANRMPGAVVAIARRGKLAYFQAFGYLDKERGVPMPLDAIFSPASMEKPMVAVAALQLVEHGRMVMGDPVEKYIPQFAGMRVARMSPDGAKVIGTEPQKRPMTIQDLMRHTAGLTYGRRGDSELFKQYPSSSNWSAEHLTGDEFIARLSKLPLFYQPGTRWDYSFGFDVLGLVIERITGKRLGDTMEETIFAPLGMVDTAFVIAPDKRARYAHALPINPDTGKPQRIRDVRERGRFDCGGGCASYTAADYLRFSQMLLNGGILDGQRILSRKTVEYMTSEQLGDGVDRTALHEYPNIDGYGFGLGVAVREGSGVSTFIGSPGDFHWSGANGTYFDVDPKEQLVIVFMAVTPGEPRLRYRQLINALVYQAIEN